MSVSGVIGLAVGIVRGIILQKHGGVAGFIRGAAASLFVGVVVSLGLADMSLSITTKSAITAICCFIADDILLGLLSLAGLLGKDPIGFFSRLSAAYRGQVSDQKDRG
jgi:hypothetical protein